MIQVKSDENRVRVNVGYYEDPLDLGAEASAIIIGIYSQLIRQGSGLDADTFKMFVKETISFEPLWRTAEATSKKIEVCLRQKDEHEAEKGDK